jgi:hypothetical protein
MALTFEFEEADIGMAAEDRGQMASVYVGKSGELDSST